ncbi:hypothetical protein CICLE_v10023217mg [Citrus x clementina]|uniref:Uncharacterized protein n=1 Tax=Citrus clementina TaxID=85681 RepID=V4TWR2_CITCL|nr:hypothetical protein CICLE_v10023217mg [Citrus x clementina]
MIKLMRGKHLKLSYGISTSHGCIRGIVSDQQGARRCGEGEHDEEHEGMKHKWVCCKNDESHQVLIWNK